MPHGLLAMPGWNLKTQWHSSKYAKRLMSARVLHTTREKRKIPQHIRPPWIRMWRRTERGARNWEERTLAPTLIQNRLVTASFARHWRVRCFLDRAWACLGRQTWYQTGIVVECWTARPVHNGDTLVCQIFLRGLLSQPWMEQKQDSQAGQGYMIWATARWSCVYDERFCPIQNFVGQVITVLCFS